MKPKLYRVRYKRITVRLDINPRKGICQVCGRVGLTNIHHLVYSYSTADVRKNPMLVLDNILELCFLHHLVADALRIVDSNPSVVEKLKSLVVVKS